MPKQNCSLHKNHEKVPIPIRIRWPLPSVSKLVLDFFLYTFGELASSYGNEIGITTVVHVNYFWEKIFNLLPP